MGLQLPPELVTALSWVGCYWPEADEAVLKACGDAWLDFARRADDHAMVGTAAVDAMVAENAGPGIDAFVGHWEQVAGPGGYLFDCRIVAAAVAIAFYQAAIFVLALKLLLIVQLIGFAVILAAAVAAAVFTCGSSLAFAAEVAWKVNRFISAAVLLTTSLVRALGPPLAEIAREHLSDEIKHLDDRSRNVFPSQDRASPAADAASSGLVPEKEVRT
ncbi:MAG TPA: hypothetical protein VIL34_15430 [Actinopolymorphaceae bacterium]